MYYDVTSRLMTVQLQCNIQGGVYLGRYTHRQRNEHEHHPLTFSEAIDVGSNCAIGDQNVLMAWAQ